MDIIDYQGEGICVSESAHKRIMKLMNLLETNLDQIQSLIDLKHIFPIANYYITKKPSKIMSRYCKFICVSRNQGFRNSLTFLENYKFMARATIPLFEQMSLLIQYMIYYDNKLTVF